MYNTSEVVDIEDNSSVQLIIVGVVSNDAQTFLEPHGDFKSNTKFPAEFRKAKLRLSLSAPLDPALAADFATGVQNLKHLQGLVAKDTGIDKGHFITATGDLKFSFALWDKKASYNLHCACFSGLTFYFMPL